jgi:hypothetical protein
MSTTPLTKAFLSGYEQVYRSMPDQWQSLLPLILPQCSGILLQQLQAVQTELAALLNAPPDPKIPADTIVIPITLVNDYANALNTFEYQFSGFPNNLYTNTRNELDSVFNQYSSAYWNSGSTKQPFWYGG